MEEAVKSKANIMVLKTDSPVGSRLDWLKWLVVTILLLAGMVANHYYSEVSMLIRGAGWLVVLAMAGLVATQTQKGRWTVNFFRDSRAELRKVFWPTREETTQTTLVVSVMVIVMALMLWGIDGILVWVIGWLTGQRG